MKWSEAHERVQTRDARMCAYAMPQVVVHDAQCVDIVRRAELVSVAQNSPVEQRVLEYVMGIEWASEPK
eukprot:8317983-Alexandrium_andersonii.AAC.1